MIYTNILYNRSAYKKSIKLKDSLCMIKLNKLCQIYELHFNTFQYQTEQIENIVKRMIEGKLQYYLEFYLEA